MRHDAPFSPFAFHTGTGHFDITQRSCCSRCAVTPSSIMRSTMLHFALPTNRYIYIQIILNHVPIAVGIVQTHSRRDANNLSAFSFPLAIFIGSTTSMACRYSGVCWCIPEFGEQTIKIRLPMEPRQRQIV